MKSIFDGWEKQIKGCLDDNGGGFCALGWMHHVGDADYDGIFQPAFTRIRGWTRANLAKDITDANNDGDLDIEGFRMVDLLTQGYVPEDSPESYDAKKRTAVYAVEE